MLRVIHATEAREEGALEEEAEDKSPDAAGEANLVTGSRRGVRAGVPVLPLPLAVAHLTPLVFQGVCTGVSVPQLLETVG